MNGDVSRVLEICNERRALQPCCKTETCEVEIFERGRPAITVARIVIFYHLTTSRIYIQMVLMDTDTWCLYQVEPFVSLDLLCICLLPQKRKSHVHSC